MGYSTHLAEVLAFVQFRFHDNRSSYRERESIAHLEHCLQGKKEDCQHVHTRLRNGGRRFILSVLWSLRLREMALVVPVTASSSADDFVRMFRGFMANEPSLQR